MRGVCAAMLCAALLLAWRPLHAQGWAADLYAGTHRYGAPAEPLRSTSLIAGLRHGSPLASWFYAAAGAPVDGDAPTWAAAGAARRLVLASLGGTFAAGAAGAADGYLYRDRVAEASGRGLTLEAAPWVEGWRDRYRGELRVGWRQHFASHEVEESSRAAAEASLRLERHGSVQVGGGARVVTVTEGTYAAVSVDASVAVGPVRIAAGLEQWLSADVEDTGWLVYASMPVYRAELWAGFRHDARDPLYWNATRRAWNAGVSMALGRRSSPPQPTVRIEVGGDIVIRVLRSAAEGDVQVAGDFTGWERRPMTAAGDWWEFRLRLPAGVYHYAFVDGAEQWFVPEDTPGRIDDGMGGHVAVLVVP